MDEQNKSFFCLQSLTLQSMTKLLVVPLSCAGFSSDEDSPAPRHRKRTYMNQPHLRFEITSDDGFKVQASSIEGKNRCRPSVPTPLNTQEPGNPTLLFPSSGLARGDGWRPGGPGRLPPQAAAAGWDGRAQDDGRRPRCRHLPAGAAAGRRQLQTPPLPLPPLRRLGGGATAQPQRLCPLRGLRQVNGSRGD